MCLKWQKICAKLAKKGKKTDKLYWSLNVKGIVLPIHSIFRCLQEEAYTLFLGNSNWYLFLRLHAILCERLRTMYERAQALAVEEAKHRGNRRESTATALRLKPKSEIQVEDYYPTFLDMLKNVLDGNMEANNYEDSLREMFGIHAYVAFTLDRVRNFFLFYFWVFGDKIIEKQNSLRYFFYWPRLSQMPCANCNIVWLNEELWSV